MKRLVVVLFALALLVACAEETPEEDAAGEGFTLTGRVVEVQEGAEPEGVPDLVDDAAGEARTGGEAGEDEGVADEPGGIAVEVEDAPAELQDCPMQQGTLTVFYTDNTRFLPADAVDDDGFPESLEGATVDVTGAFYEAEAEAEVEGADDGSAEAEVAGCALVAESIAVEEGDADADTGDPASRESPTPGPRTTGAPDASPGASPLETSEATAAP